jgi:hypothetical protein
VYDRTEQGLIRREGWAKMAIPLVDLPLLTDRWICRDCEERTFSNGPKMFDQIEKLKLDLTDKFVVVDAQLPELMRFDGHVGQVKTVNMNGRALVQFDAWNNIGWYDIDVECLRVVPKPEAGSEAKKSEAKPVQAKAAPAAAGDKKLSPLEMARMQGAAKPGGGSAKAAGGAKASTSDVLAAARANKAAPAEAASKPAAAGKMSTADIVAAARAKKAAEAELAAPQDSPAAKPTAPAGATPQPAAGKIALTSGQRLGVPEILAWCRAHDAK